MPLPTRRPREKAAWLAAVSETVRVAGGLMALGIAVLWATTGMLPALGSLLSELPSADQALLGRLALTLDSNGLPGHGHLPLPVLAYDLGPSLPFVLAFLFVFTARGLLDGDGWARTSGLLLAGLGCWLCAFHVVNPDARRLGVALCVGILVAAVGGRFGYPTFPMGIPAQDGRRVR